MSPQCLRMCLHIAAWRLFKGIKGDIFEHYLPGAHIYRNGKLLLILRRIPVIKDFKFEIALT